MIPVPCPSATSRVGRRHSADRLRPHGQGDVRVFHGLEGAPHGGRHNRGPADPRRRTVVAPLLRQIGARPRFCVD